jgi:hypothetical protein
MSQERTRRPARKRRPEERLPPAAQPVNAEPDGPAMVPNRIATNDPGGWLAIGLFAVAFAAVAIIAILIWMAM